MKTLDEQLDESLSSVCGSCFEKGHTADGCPSDKKDLALVGSIAAFIAARLNYIVPECNGPRKYVGRGVSTIKVTQHKEKFWYCRVYCKLADFDLVKRRWVEESRPEGSPSEPTQEFRDKCFRADAYHYRKCHLDMLKLLPERMHRRVTRDADYQELLFPTVADMEKRIDSMEANDLQSEHHHDSLGYYRNRYDVETNLELKEKLRKLYAEPSIRDQIGDV